MKTRVITMREKIIASVASVALAASMAVCVPGAAFATYETGDISATQSSINLTAGDQEYMDQYFTYYATGGDGQWHIDYEITSGDDIASINKHTGLLTVTSAGTVIVTAHLTGAAVPEQGTTNNPCADAPKSATISVNISNDGADYGYQGVGNTIMMTSPSVTSFIGNNTDGWINTLGTYSADADGYYYFTIVMTNGFKDYNTADAFAGINAGKVMVISSDGETTNSLNTDNQGAVTISTVNNSTKTVTVKLASSVVSSGAILFFDTGFRGNSATNTLGTTISFVL